MIFLEDYIIILDINQKEIFEFVGFKGRKMGWFRKKSISANIQHKQENEKVIKFSKKYFGRLPHSKAFTYSLDEKDRPDFICYDCGKVTEHIKTEYWFDRNLGKSINLCQECWNKRRKR